MENQDTEQQTIDQEEAIRVWFQHVHQVLSQEFPEYEVEGQVAEHPMYGHLFAFRLKDQNHSYACGFLLAELVRNFQSKEDPGEWLSSFYVDMIKSGESNLFPAPPQSEEEAKKIIDEKVVPHCAQSIREEFDEPVHVDLELNPEHGPVLEAGFPSIKDGNNTCAMPLNFLLTLYLLNRDPSEPIIQALYKLRE